MKTTTFYYGYSICEKLNAKHCHTISSPFQCSFVDFTRAAQTTALGNISGKRQTTTKLGSPPLRNNFACDNMQKFIVWSMYSSMINQPGSQPGQPVQTQSVAITVEMKASPLSKQKDLSTHMRQTDRYDLTYIYKYICPFQKELCYHL